MISGRLFITLLNVFFLAGCVGPKFMSNSFGSQEVLAPIPKHLKVIVSQFDDYGSLEKVDNQAVGAYFATVLANKLLLSGLFPAVTVSSSPPDSTQIVISGSVSSIDKHSWGKRALIGNAESGFEITGEIRDHKSNKLMNFTKSRSAQGGLFGVGGWATAGSGQMVKQLADWVATDVLNAIKKGMKSK